MWKYFSPIFAALMLICLLAGCAEVPVPMGPNTDPTEPVGNETTVPTVTISGIPEVENPGSSLIEYDPDREYYFHVGNMDLTHHSRVFSLGFYILAKKEIDINGVEIAIPCENDYSYAVSEVDVIMRDTIYNQHGTSNAGDARYLPYEVYAAYRGGIDYDLALYFHDLVQNPPIEGTEEAEEAREKTGGRNPGDCYSELVNMYQADYQELTPEDIREFYLYSVSIVFDVVVEETVTAMDVTISDQTIHHELGMIRLVPAERELQYDYAFGNGLGFTQGDAKTQFSDFLTESASVQLDFFFRYAEQDLTLEEFSFFEEVEVLDLTLNMISPDGMTISTGWDGKTPVDIYEGDAFSVTVMIREPKLADLYFHIELNAELVMTIDGEKYSDQSSQTLEPGWNWHEVYAIVFDGVDMGPYHRFNNKLSEA